MNTRVITGLALLGCSLGGLISATSAQAQFLVGAELFAADASGATTNHTYQYDTNSNNSSARLSINGLGSSIAVPLSAGSNVLTFTQSANSPISGQGGATNGDLGLFFSATNTPYNPSSTSRTPDLIVSENVNGTTSFFFPTAGVSVNNYAFEATPLPANGATTLTLGGSLISISAYSVTDTPTGTFTVNVSSPTATPEPGSIALLSGLGLSGGVFALRRRRRK